MDTQKGVNTKSKTDKTAISNVQRIQNLGANGSPDVILLYGGTNDYGQLNIVDKFDKTKMPTEVDLKTIQWGALSQAFAHTVLRVKHFFPDICFAAVYGQREGVSIKPDPTIVSDILSDTGITRAETIYIGDSGVDMQTARNAEVECIGVSWGFRSVNELLDNGADHIVHHAEEIANLIL